MRIQRLCLLIGVTVVSWSAHVEVAQAWGEEGHMAVAKIADLNLSPKAHRAVDDLLTDKGNIFDKSIAMWADRFKQTKAGAYSKTWHYVDIPYESEEYLHDRDCANDNCVVEHILEQVKILRDAKATADARTQALKFVVHLVGDIHQPLHCTEHAKDRGGNEVSVHYFGSRSERLNLHRIWDTNLVQDAMDDQSVEEFAKSLNDSITPDVRTTWENNKDIAEWAITSHDAAVKYAYSWVNQQDSDVIEIGKDYIDAAKPVITQQIEKAGVRLARLLNEALDQ